MSDKWTWKRVEFGLYTCEFSKACPWRAEVVKGWDFWRVWFFNKADSHYRHNCTAKTKTLKEAKAFAIKFICGEGMK